MTLFCIKQSLELIIIMTGGVKMKRYLLTTAVIGIMVLTGCSLKNNSVVDNDDKSDIDPMATPSVNYQTVTCKKDNTNVGVDDNTTYIIKHDGDTVKSITMKMDYKLNETSGKELFDNNKSILTNITDKFKDIAGLTTNIVEDSVDLFKAEVNLEIDKMKDDDMGKFDDFKVSKSLKEQKKHFEDKGINCN